MITHQPILISHHTQFSHCHCVTAVVTIQCNKGGLAVVRVILRLMARSELGRSCMASHKISLLVFEFCFSIYLPEMFLRCLQLNVKINFSFFTFVLFVSTLAQIHFPSIALKRIHKKQATQDWHQKENWSRPPHTEMMTRAFFVGRSIQKLNQGW